MRRALKPTDAEIRALPLGANTKFARDLLGDGRRRALDIGCGEGKFTRGLAAFVGEVAGVDVKANSIAKAQQAAKAEGVNVDFRVASGDALPWPDRSFDVVAFSNSLHHMPDFPKALAEAARALGPGGLLYVMEPVAAGHYHEATRFVNDETIVRTQAWTALRELLGQGMERVQENLYRTRRAFASFDEWKEEQLDRDEKRRAKFDADPEGVKRTFETLADKEDGKLAFDQVFRVDLLRKG
ncbi:MAG: 2-polyprenyl-3-methyl-5-hydroxy-6-metoxy,4-benzoquinol methylase [Hyphomicrobiales bacterium]|nr:2-polyprenyl-3-methyl-5-hydroxy-6-metoxy,4-benzoquinol methylase [Hyphomicrobiales bacterium]